jgi:hypothetical protein
MSWGIENGEWVHYPDPPSNGSNGNGNNGNNSSNPNGGNNNSNGHGNSNANKYKKVKIGVLSGEMSVVVNKRNLAIECGDTIRAQGFGSFMSGGMFVSTRTITVEKDSGLSLKLGVIRPNFVNTVKGDSKYNID